MGKRQHFLSTAGSQRKTGILERQSCGEMTPCGSSQRRCLRCVAHIWCYLLRATLWSPHLVPSGTRSWSSALFMLKSAWRREGPSISWYSVTNQPPAQHLETIMFMLTSLLVSRPGSDMTDFVWACLCICGQLAVQLGLVGWLAVSCGSLAPGSGSLITSY